MSKLHLVKGMLWGILIFSTPFLGNAQIAMADSTLVAVDSVQTMPDTNLTIFQKLAKDSITQLTLTADFDFLLKNKKLNDEYPAFLTLKVGNDSTTSLGLKIRPRGVYRRKFCDSPPLRLNFDKKELKKLGLNSDFDKLKLVTHCMENESAEQVLLREYWAYKLYNNLTPKSFKVHLVKITYVNVNDSTEQMERLAFLIENNKEMAQRIGGEIVDKWGLTPSKLEATTHQDAMIFNYMIGNLDWHIERNRNVKLVEMPSNKGIAVVPYDFDMSAFVFPSYARLNPDYKQVRFTDRYCVGQFSSKEALAETTKKVQALQPTIFSLFEDCPYLDEESKSAMTKYLKSFYKLLKKEKKWAKIFL